MNRLAISRDTLSSEAQHILRTLKENSRLGRSNKLADVKSSMEPSVSLEFDSYFFFLRKFHYIAMDREAQLKLTDQGERVIDGDQTDRFSVEVGEFFSDQLVGGDDHTHTLVEFSGGAPTAPPPSSVPDVSVDELELPLRSREASTATATAPPAQAPLPALRREPGFPLPPPQVPPVNLGLAPSAPLAPGKGTEIDLKYVKFDPIGSGPLGTVFKGRQSALNIDVALKELKDIFGYFSFLQRGEVIKRLKRELCAQAQIRHPSVVAVLDQNTDVARPYFVEELCRGSLREKLDQSQGKGLNVVLSVRYFLQLAYALRAAHLTGLTHHNLKPENILFDTFGNAKVADFGIGRVIEVDQSKGMPQVFIGTGGMAYMAPELISRNKDVGPSADVYGAGILLYEMLTGQIPGRRSPLPSEVNPEVPSKLDPIFDKMTQDRREQRYPDFDAMLDEFYGAFSDGEYLVRGDLIVWS